jgi:pimeloyl-ACP methyl ester carboxylesterase
MGATARDNDTWSNLVADQHVELPDGRTIAWTISGDPTGRPVLRVPGTPGCRWTVRADQLPWVQRGLLMITTERPGFGATTRVPGRGFDQPADDIIAILDHLGVEKVPVYGSSGAAPHILALCARHPSRISAATILAGAAPVTDSEAEDLLPINQQARQLALAGDLPGLQALLAPVRQAVLSDPLVSFRNLMATAPEDDLAILSDPSYQESFVRAMREAIAQGVEGWADESLANFSRWDDIDLGAVTTSVRWRHAALDRNAPESAARRIVDALPHGHWSPWPAGGHLVAYHHEGDVLDDLLARAA